MIAMLLAELKKEILKLPSNVRLALVSDIIESLQSQSSFANRSAAISQMRGLLKTTEPAPTDQQVAMMLEQRLEKYL
jgi:hypothetical protein